MLQQLIPKWILATVRVLGFEIHYVVKNDTLVPQNMIPNVGPGDSTGFENWKIIVKG